MRQMSLSLWGSSCTTIANNVTFPGTWLGPTTVSIKPLTCTSLFAQAVNLGPFGTASQPTGVFNTPPFYLQATVTNLDGSELNLASEGQVLGYLTVGQAPCSGHALPRPALLIARLAGSRPLRCSMPV